MGPCQAMGPAAAVFRAKAKRRVRWRRIVTDETGVIPLGDRPTETSHPEPR